MSTREEAAFKSDRAEVLHWWEDSQAARAAFHAQVDAFTDEHGMGRKAVILSGWSIYLAGFETVPEDYTDGPPEGWRLMKGKHVDWIQPYRTSKARKALSDEMGAIRMPETRETLPGYDFQIFTGGLPGLFLHNGTVWLNTNHPDQIDPEVWEACRLSEFHSAREDMTEARPVDA